VISFNINSLVIQLKPLFYFILGIVFYSIFIFKFYRFLATKDLLKLDLDRYNNVEHSGLKKFIKAILYPFEYMIVIPVFIFFWFMVLTTLLVFLAKNPVIENILLISLSLVASVRITSYYDEDLSKDLAKMLPFALLGVFLVDASYFSFSESIILLKSIPSHWVLLLTYLMFIVILEFILRIIIGTYNLIVERWF